MEVTISLGLGFQIVGGVFTIATVVAYVKYTLAAHSKDNKLQDEKLKSLDELGVKLTERVRTVEAEGVTRAEAHKVFVSKEVLEIHLKGILRAIDEVKTMLKDKQ
jgi:hypothetical protein